MGEVAVDSLRWEAAHEVEGAVELLVGHDLFGDFWLCFFLRGIFFNRKIGKIGLDIIENSKKREQCGKTNSFVL